MFPKILRRDVILLLGLKAALLLTLYYFVIAPAKPPEPDARATRAHLLDRNFP
jgi:hypothetical protein